MSVSSDTIGGMGRAGKALKEVLVTHGISQNRLAVTLGVKPSVVFRWFHEQTDPSAETAANIVQALQGIEPAAAEMFVQLYLGDLFETKGEDEQNPPGTQVPG